MKAFWLILLSVSITIAHAQDNYFPLSIGDYIMYQSTINEDAYMRQTVIDQFSDGEVEYYHILRALWNVSTGNPPDTTFTDLYYRYNPCNGLYSYSTVAPNPFIIIPLATQNPVDVGEITEIYNNAELLLSISNIGEFTTPYGTFQSCYQVEGYLSSGATQYPHTSLILAPGIGPVSFASGGGLAEPTPWVMVDKLITPPEPIEETEELVQILHYHHLENNQLFSEPKIISDSSNDNFFSVCADSSKSSSFRITSLEYLDLTQVAVRLTGNNSTDEILGRLSIVNVTETSIDIDYQHPEIIPENMGAYHLINLDIYNPNSDCIIYKSLPIKVYRAPVLLLHGLKGTGNSMKELEKYLKENGNYLQFQLVTVDYEDSNDSAFNENRWVIPDEIDRIFEFFIEKDISVGKVDIVAHSMGGLLSRLYLQSDFYRFDINKLITLNSPHFGSQIANLVLDEDFPATRKNIVCKFLDCGEEALNDLRVNSQAILETLNGSNINKNKVFSHAIVTTINVLDSGIGQWLLWGTGLNAEEFNELFNGDTHDLIVSYISQTGGLGMDFISSFTHEHTDSYNFSEVQQKIDFLLKQPPNSPFFTKNGYTPTTLSYETPNVFANNGDNSELEVQITSPFEGQIFLYGESITLSAQGEEITENLSFLVGENLFDYEQTETIEDNHANVNYLITPSRLGKLPISVLASGENRAGHDETYILVTTNLVPDTIRPLNNNTTAYVGKRRNVVFYGLFPEFGEVSIDQDPNTQYNFKYGFAEYIGEGKIKGVSPGVDTLTVTFNGVESKPMRIVVIDEPTTSTQEDFQKTQKANYLEVFPNPTSDYIIAKNFLDSATNGTFYVSEINGRRISKTVFDLKAGENLTRIDLSGLPDGVFLLSIVTEAGIATQKVVKQ